ncbi:MAG: HepT-like ribonuclease domain-containing protein [Microcoleaceae cyanobacterium]
MKNDQLYLTHIKEAVARIESYTSSGKDDFLDRPLIQDGVIRNFEVIGEATKRLSQELKLENPDIPWRQISGFRDVLIHDYYQIKIERVWQFVEEEIPILKQKIESLLSKKNE